ncbi:MAG: response regulator [Deltaproteobacteria bacterium]|nr:response regulator [Deltaproteobacteria bacterium]
MVQTDTPRLAGWLGVIVAGLGSIVAGAWLVGAERLTRLLPGLASMKFNTAVAFVTAGLALFVSRRKPSGLMLRMRDGLATAVLLLATVSLLEDAAGFRSGLDELVVADPASATAPGRMSAGTALCFVLSGVGLLALRRGRGLGKVALAELFGMSVGVLSLSVLMAYLYDVEDLYAVDLFSSIAIHTAALFALLSVGILLASPHHSFVRLVTGETPAVSFGKRILLAVVLVPIVVGYLVHEASDSGIIPLGFSVALIVTLTIVTLTLVVYAVAARMDRLEIERQEARALADRMAEAMAQARRMELVARFAGGLAHDFNNILSVIIGQGQLALLDLEEGHEARSAVEEVERAGLRAQELTRQLLLMSRREISPNKVLDLRALVEELAVVLRPLLGETIELHVHVASDLGHVRGSRVNMERVLTNLAVNARDAMPSGGRLEIELKNARVDARPSERHVGLEPGDFVVITVSDSGTGMDAATRDRVFEPFFSTKAPGQGTGLGLSTVHSIVQQAGGYLSVDSELGRGTRFEIFLPCIRAPADVEQTAGVHGLDVQLFGRGETVLVVEDEADVRRMACAVLRRYGYRPIEAEDPLEALELLATRDEVDLVLSDVVMPKMSGPEFAEKARAVRAGLVVLFMSGYDASGEAAARLRSDDVLLNKPLDTVRLLREVQAALA